MVNIRRVLEEHSEVVRQVEALSQKIEEVASLMVSTLKQGGKVIWMGNGGSAADAQHLAAELVGRFSRERSALPSIALTADTSVVTAVANDYGFELVFSRQIEALCRSGDLVIGISTSGNSKNVCLAIQRAKEIGAYTVALTGGTGGKLSQVAHISVIVPSSVTARIQEAHILIGHIWCQLVEEALVVGSQNV
jgi:D-sedoheptulose 7-phosphate isomerase